MRPSELITVQACLQVRITISNPLPQMFALAARSVFVNNSGSCVTRGCNFQAGDAWEIVETSTHMYILFVKVIIITPSRFLNDIWHAFLRGVSSLPRVTIEGEKVSETCNRVDEGDEIRSNSKGKLETGFVQRKKVSQPLPRG